MKNSEVIDKFTACITNKRVVDFVRDQHKIDVTRKPPRSYYQHAVERLKKQYQRLNKNKKRPGVQEELEKLRQSDFQFPQQQDQPERTVETQRVVATQTTITAATPSSYALKENETLKVRLQEKMSELKRKRSSISYLEEKVSRKEKQIEVKKLKLEETSAQCTELLQDLDSDRKKVSDLLQENEWLREMVQVELKTTNDDGSYTMEMKECVCNLLTHNVSTGQVSPVIAAVLKLAGRTPTKLPGKSTINEWNVMRLAIAQKQLAEEIPSTSHIGILSDETSKFGTKFEGFHAVDEKGRVFVLGLREISSKAGKDVLSTFQSIVRDIEDQQTDVGNQIVAKISSTMSDRAATQLKFNELLEEYRKEILPLTYDKYDELSEAERESLGKLCNFFCGLHALVHLAEVADAALVETENACFNNESPIFDKQFKKATESGTTQLIRTTCKSVAEGGDEKNGCYSSFLEYVRPALKQDGFQSLPIHRFRGNRFNVLFENAGSVFYLADSLKEYLKGGAVNRLLKAVDFDLNVAEYMAGCKALGLISCLVTVPLWTSIEDTSIHIIDIGSRYQEIVDYLKMASERSEDFMNGDLLLSFANVRSLERSAIFQKLTQSWEHDDKVVLILQVVLPAMSRQLQRLFVDHLKGGKWDNASAAVRDATKGLPSHNKFSESIFGHLDRLMREKPRITTIASEAYIIFSHNSTMKWLESKSVTDKAKIFSEARKSTKEITKLFKERQRQIQEAQRKRVLEKLSETRALQQRRMAKLEQHTMDIQFWGLWQSEREVDEYLASLVSKQSKLKALKAQLNFRNKVLKQLPFDKSENLYAFSEKKVEFPPEKLASNLKKLIREAFSGRQQEEQDQASTSDGDPLLVGKRINHRFKADGENEKEWYTGKVISQVPGYPQWYNVKYDGDIAVYTFRLLEDYRRQDLKIIV